MPTPAEMTAAVSGCKFISTVDATSFFYQWPVKMEDRHKFSAVSHRGQEIFKVAMMGFKNSPAYTQRMIDRLLREAGAQKFARAYIDNLVIFSKSLQEHLTHLETVFDALSKWNLTLSGNKSFLGFPSIPLLGQRVDGFGLSTEEEKLDAIRNLQFPSTLKDLEHYLGLTGYLRSYIQYYAQLAEPLQTAKTAAGRNAPKTRQARLNFAKRGKIEPTEELLTAFQGLQEAFAKPSTLIHFDPDRPMYIHLDASKKRGFGIMVCHLEGDQITDDPLRRKTQPILFLSKTLSTAERNYWPTELEVAGLVYTYKRIRRLIESCRKPVIVLTDHSTTTAIVK